MELISKDVVLKSGCAVHYIHVVVQDVAFAAKEIITLIKDKSWISSLNAVDQVAFDARASRTIAKLVNDVLTKVISEVTAEFGEYLITYTAQETLITHHEHGRVPWAELFKEKISGNMGFDFHTQSKSEIIIFGESKYSSDSNPYSNALEQIVDFINDKKDEGELSDVSKFVSGTASLNATKKIKGFVAAFSLNAKNPAGILKNALECGFLNPLLVYPEIYLIGIEINDQSSN